MASSSSSNYRRRLCPARGGAAGVGLTEALKKTSKRNTKASGITDTERMLRSILDDGDGDGGSNKKTKSKKRPRAAGEQQHNRLPPPPPPPRGRDVGVTAANKPGGGKEEEHWSYRMVASAAASSASSASSAGGRNNKCLSLDDLLPPPPKKSRARTAGSCRGTATTAKDGKKTFLGKDHKRRRPGRSAAAPGSISGSGTGPIGGTTCTTDADSAGRGARNAVGHGEERTSAAVPSQPPMVAANGGSLNGSSRPQQDVPTEERRPTAPSSKEDGAANDDCAAANSSSRKAQGAPPSRRQSRPAGAAAADAVSAANTMTTIKSSILYVGRVRRRNGGGLASSSRQKKEEDFNRRHMTMTVTAAGAGRPPPAQDTGGSSTRVDAGGSTTVRQNAGSSSSEGARRVGELRQDDAAAATTAASWTDSSNGTGGGGFHDHVAMGGSFGRGTGSSSSSFRTFGSSGGMAAGGTAGSAASNDNTSGGPGRSERRRGNKSSSNNDNFVRLNMKNRHGACRQHHRKTAKKNKGDWSYGDKVTRGSSTFGAGGDDDNSVGRRGGGKGKEKKNLRVVANANVDPIDDYLDGVFDAKSDNGNDSGGTATGSSSNGGPAPDGTASIRKPGKQPGATTTTNKKRNNSNSKSAKEDKRPKCVRHGRTCKLLVVKKTSSGNKGRKFYVCSMPRGEQCDHFQWAEDTAEAAHRALLSSSSASGFVARQVASHATYFKSLTVPELRREAKLRNLRHSGKKGEVLARLFVWVRDEVAMASSKPSDGSSRSPDGDRKGVPPNSDDDEDDASSEVDVDYCDDVSGKVGGMKGMGGSSSKGFVLLSEEDSSDDELSSTDDDDDDDSSCSSGSDSDDESVASDTQPRLGRHGKEGGKSALTCTVSGAELAPSTEGSPTNVLQQIFGHCQFRPGQEWAVKRCLEKRRSLLVAPTGMGKSLCYALPAVLMEGITIVVSPLVSLMQDQLRHLPPRIPAATLSGGLSYSAIVTTIEDIVRNRIKILFVSPERLASSAFRRLIRQSYDTATGAFSRKLPHVSMLCVDEAHCLSQWGHNFRPSYLRLRSLLPLINPQSVLALTATAGPKVTQDICNTLGIPYGPSPKMTCSDEPRRSIPDTGDRDCGVKTLNANRDNIDVAACVLESDDVRRAMLFKMLKAPLARQSEKNGRSGTANPDSLPNRYQPFDENAAFSSLGEGYGPGCLHSGSVIVYVWRQKDAEILAEQIAGAGVVGGIVFYHGGMDAGRRAAAQGKFMRGKARICVATVAFGLGINKPDIVGVIHMCLPQSPENHLQEIGRAGRDGRPAKAISLILPEEVCIRHSLGHSDGIAKSQIRSFLLVLRGLVDEAVADVTADCGEDNTGQSTFLDVALPVAATVDLFDCKEESLETLVSLLEEQAHQGQALLTLESFLPDEAIVTLKRRPLEKLESREPLAKCIQLCGTRLDSSSTEKEDAANPMEGKLAEYGGTAMQKGFHAYSFGSWRFSVVRCARRLGPCTEPRHVYGALRRLQDCGEVELALDMGSNGRAMHLKLSRAGIDLLRTPVEHDKAINADSRICNFDDDLVENLTARLAQQERAAVRKVEQIYTILHKVATTKSSGDASIADKGEDDESTDDDGGSLESKSERLTRFQDLINCYFEEDSSTAAQRTHEGGRTEKSAESINSGNVGSREEDATLCRIMTGTNIDDERALAEIGADVTVLMRDPTLTRIRPYPAVLMGGAGHKDYTARAASKIFHSIDSKRAPASIWYSHPLWGKYRHYSFRAVYEAILQNV